MKQRGGGDGCEASWRQEGIRRGWILRLSVLLLSNQLFNFEDVSCNFCVCDRMLLLVSVCPYMCILCVFALVIVCMSCWCTMIPYAYWTVFNCLFCIKCRVSVSTVQWGLPVTSYRSLTCNYLTAWDLCDWLSFWLTDWLTLCGGVCKPPCLALMCTWPLHSMWHGDWLSPPRQNIKSQE